MDNDFYEYLSKDCIYFECFDISYIKDYIISQVNTCKYDQSQIEKTYQYILKNKDFFYKGNVYSVILKMSNKDIKVVNSSTLEFISDDEESVCEKDIDDLIDLRDEELEYEDSYYLPVLFNFDKKEKERIWKVWVIGNVTHRIHGLLDGDKISNKRTYDGKNEGKKNETTPEEQAKQEAEIMWVKQIDKGYFPKCKEGKAMLKRIQQEKDMLGGHNINAAAAIRGRKKKTIHGDKKNLSVENVKVEITPMKACKWELSDENNPKSVLPKVIKYFNFEEDGVYMQWKLDGYRCVIRTQINDKGEIEVVMTTNNKKQYPWFSEIRQEFIRFVKGRENLILDGLDGELYCHVIYDENGNEMDFKSRFSAIQGINSLSNKKPHLLESQMNFIVFDIVDLKGELDQDDRFYNLKQLFKNKPENTSRIQLCETKIANFMEDIMVYHDEIYNKGYEGVIIRARDLLYTEKRCLKIRKYKYFIDKEYPIIDIVKDDGVDDEYFVWVCYDPKIKDKITGKFKTFRAKPTNNIGSRDVRREIYKNRQDYLGKKLTVKFQEYTSDGIPRFPNAVGIRDDQ